VPNGFVLAIPFVVAGCAGAPSAEAPTNSAPSPGARATEPEARRAPGVALDPLLGLPRASVSAAAEQGVVVLSTPVDPRPALKIIDAFFEAVVAEASDRLERVLDRSALIRAASKARPEPALGVFRRRFERLDYTALGSELLYRPSEIEIHTARESRALTGTRAPPVMPRGDELVARVPLARTAATSRYFGSEIVFLLKPDPGRTDGSYKIGELVEDFRLP
jgi:hypothetical protein